MCYPNERMKRKLGILYLLKGFLVVTGIVSLGAYVFLLFQASAVQARLKQEFEQEIARQQAGAHSAGREAAQPLESRATIDGLAKLDIEKAGLSAMVMEGADNATLRVAVGHIPGTALPGQGGNVGLAGHRDSFFRGLRKLTIGDEITLTTRAGTLHYTVESIRVVPPDDVNVLRNTPYPALTLVTCYPFYYVGPAPQRWIVRARLTSGDTRT
jgi:sortase A